MRLDVAIAFAVLAAAPITAGAQDDRYPARPGVFQSFAEGLGAGLGLGIAFINPEGEGWLMEDESAFALSLFTGISAAVAARTLSRNQHPDDGQRPRFTVSAGRSRTTELDYTLGLRVPVARRLDVSTVLQTASDSWQLSEQQTRCDPFFGCISADYIVDERHEQSVSATVGGVFTPLANGRFHPTIAVGVGPIVTSLETFDDGRSRRTGVVADAMVGFEIGTRSRWTAEAGARVISGTATEGASLQFRAGRAFGY